MKKSKKLGKISTYENGKIKTEKLDKDISEVIWRKSLFGKKR